MDLGERNPTVDVPIVNVGLKREAIDFLNENVEMIPDIVCPDCGKEITFKQNIIDIKPTEDNVTVLTYKLKDNRIAETIKQPVDVVGDGAVVFLCLSIEGSLEFQWSDEEIQEILNSR